MFTVLAFGLCAFVIETPPDHTSFKFSAVEYPAIGIGIVGRGECRLTTVIAAGNQTPGLPINGQIHRFKVEKIDQTMVVVWIDNKQSFNVPREKAF
jgi:hypothetical protein